MFDIFAGLGWRWTAWVRSRELRHLLPALPAVAVGAGALAVTGWALSAPTGDRAQRYLREGRVALREGDAAHALVCYDRAAQLTGQGPEAVYGLAAAAGALGQRERAVQLMSGLAPLDRAGHAPAHCWMAGQLLGSAAPAPTAAALAERHLLRALEGEPEDREAVHATLGRIYLASRRLDKAEPHLTRAVRSRPSLHLAMAELFDLRGNPELARGQAELAIRYFRDRVGLDPNDVEARLGWATAAIRLGDHAGAVTVLKDGAAAMTADQLRRSLGEAYRHWSEALEKDPQASPGQKLAALQDGLRFDPSNLPLLRRLLDLSRSKGQEAKQAGQTLEAALARGEAAAAAHFVLGVDAWERDRKAEGRLHLERAFELAPEMPTVANNLAWMQAHGQTPDIQRAFKLIDATVQKFPDQIRFRDTRGHILLKLGRHREALVDLEASLLAGPTNRPALHKALAEAYDALGVPRMAAEHRRLAEPRNK